MNTQSTTNTAAEHANAVAETIRGEAVGSEERRRLTDVAVETLRDVGLFRMFVPEVYNGPAYEPLDGILAIETVATADGAAGWCVNIASTTSSMSWYLRPDFASEIYGDPLTISGGAFAPGGRGHRVDDGYVIDQGTWAWGSGTQHCNWINAGVKMDDGTFHLTFIPAEKVRFLDNWYASGLRGTGSTDYSVTDVFVPDGRSLQPGITSTFVDTPLCHFPNFGLLAAGLASVAVGIGRRAVDEAYALAQEKSPAMSSKKLAENAVVQIDLARAEATLSSARAFLHEQVTSMWDALVAGVRVPNEQKVRLRLACHHAGASAAEATDAAYTVSGGAAVYSSHPLQRCLRDVHVATQHAMLSPRNLETYSRITMGLPADVGLL